jgi:hypothetical protein
VPPPTYRPRRRGGDADDHALPGTMPIRKPMRLPFPEILGEMIGHDRLGYDYCHQAMRRRAPRIFMKDQA